jgi:citrate synthase
LYYRGKDAVDLSEVATLEEVAGLLWGAEAVDFERAWRAPAVAIVTGMDGRAAGRAAAVESEWVRGARGKSIGTPLQRAFHALGQRASVDLSSYGRALPILQAEAAGVFVTLALAMLGSEGASRAGVRLSQRGLKGNYAPLHERVANTFGRPSAADVLRRVLILVADHELNASTFATRVAVSTGAPLSAGVLSGLATLSGPLHGRAALGVLELLASVERFGADVAVRDWLSQGRPIVGFGHPLYPAGDPRAAALLPQLTLPGAYTELSSVVDDMIGERPNIDFALAALTKVHRLPPEAPLILFALGRCAGWLAHALEQVTTGHPIRPRARYVGPPALRLRPELQPGRR